MRLLPRSHLIRVYTVSHFAIPPATFKCISVRSNLGYPKTPKTSGHPNNCCNYPTTGTVSFNYRVMGPNNAVGIANSVDHDRLLIWICTVCQDLSVRKLRIITVFSANVWVCEFLVFTWFYQFRCQHRRRRSSSEGLGVGERNSTSSRGDQLNSLCNHGDAPHLETKWVLFYFFMRVLRPIKVISIILSRVNRKVGQKREIPWGKTPDHPQPELGLSHVTRARLKPTAVRWQVI